MTPNLFNPMIRSTPSSYVLVSTDTSNKLYNIMILRAENRIITIFVTVLKNIYAYFNLWNSFKIGNSTPIGYTPNSLATS